MKTNYFVNCRTAEELKKEYFRLAMIHHPDQGGDVEIMKKINAEYDLVWPLLKNKHADEKGTEYTSNQETAETSSQYPDIINKIINFVGVKIEICGSWIWLSDNTYEYKAQIKEAGFKWSNKKFMWYWRSEENRSWFNKKTHDMDYIRSKYGSEAVENKPLSAIA